ncbi:MAG: hypothetical protein HUK25_02335, partial [Treponema sp.]|nr:hypothetical protein [Treponema sp.]
KAGNESADTISLKVDQDSDRPEIVLNSIKTDGTTTLNHGTIAGNVTDDDGVEKFEIKLTKKDSSSTVIKDWTEVSAGSGGQFTYEVPVDSVTKKPDGNYRIWFRVKDKAGTTFTSSDATNQPRISTLNDTAVVGTYIDYDVDSTPPVINPVEITRRNMDDTADETVPFAQGEYYGGKLREKATLIVTAKDTIITNPADLVVTYSIQIGDDENSVLVDNEVLPNVTGTNQYAKEINFGSLTRSGAAVVTVKAADKSGEPATKSYTIFVDNLPPDVNTAVTNFVPAAGYEVTGDVTVTANISDEDTARSQINASKVGYYIPTKAENDSKPTTAAGWAAFSQKWTSDNMTASEALMKIELTGLSKNSADIADAYADFEISEGEKVYNIPLWLKLEDKMGNVTYITNNLIRYNPDRARPKVRILYPVEDQTVQGSSKGYVILGGTIRLSGTAEDNEGIKAVFVQYDIDGNGKFESADATWLKSNIPNTKIYKISDGTEITNGVYEEDEWGIKATGTLSWSTSFDAEKLTNPTALEVGNAANPNNDTFNIRVKALDTDGTSHVSAAQEIHVSVNNSAPVFGEFKLKQYGNSSYTGTAIRTVDYEQDVYISGDNWRLEGSVTDANGIDTVTDTKNTVITNDITNGKAIIYELDTAKTRFETRVTVRDKETPRYQESTMDFSVNIDNVKPVLAEASGKVLLYQGTYGGTKVDEKIHIQESNGSTVLTSRVTEGESGFDKLIFYVERYGGTAENKTNHRIYNIVESTNNRIDISSSGVHINEDNLPVYDVTDNTRTQPDEFKVPDAVYNVVRPGWVVKIGGNYHLIAQKIDATKSIKFKEQVDVSFKTASFVYGNVVNTPGEIGRSDTDGDGILEDYTKSGSDYIWSAQFNSTNIPDGPVWIHFVAFDVAGNMTHGSVQTRISNNVARITSVKLGTDLNNYNGIEPNETTTFYAFKDSHGNGDTTKGVSVWNLVTSE